MLLHSKILQRNYWILGVNRTRRWVFQRYLWWRNLEALHIKRYNQTINNTQLWWWPVYKEYNEMFMAYSALSNTHIRYKRENIIVLTFFYGDKKLDVNNALSLLSKEVVQIHEPKIATRIFNKFYKFVVEITLVSCDSPARAELMALMNPSGYNACPCSAHPFSILAFLSKAAIEDRTYVIHILIMNLKQEVRKRQLK